jgi:LAO/AO transport system kinase
MSDSIAELGARVISGDRRALARSITLVESTTRTDRADAAELLDIVLPHTGSSARIGLSGAPGTGKSTLIDALGIHLISAGHRVAVLAIDPSSARSGGSILGDKTRMSRLGADDRAFIRPTASRGVLGGVARHSREAVLLCEAAGFDVVLVETVGVGQSEVAIADLVDLFVLVASPAGGDELQGIKRGIMELADVIVVNKADGDLAVAAAQACADLRNAVHLLRPKRPGWTVEVHTSSALHDDGISDLWSVIAALHERLRREGVLDDLRSKQAVAWMWTEITQGLLDRFRSDPQVAPLLQTMEHELAAGRVTSARAAEVLLDAHAVDRAMPTTESG